MLNQSDRDVESAGPLTVLSTDELLFQSKVTEFSDSEVRPRVD